MCTDVYQRFESSLVFKGNFHKKTIFYLIQWEYPDSGSDILEIWPSCFEMGGQYNHSSLRPSGYIDPPFLSISGHIFRYVLARVRIFFHYGFLGEVLFKSDLPGVVLKVGFYLLAHANQKTISISIFLFINFLVPLFNSNDISIYCNCKDHHLIVNSKREMGQKYFHFGGVLFKLGLYFFNFTFWLGLY